MTRRPPRHSWRKVWSIPWDGTNDDVNTVAYPPPDDVRMYKQTPHRYVLELFSGDENEVEDSVTLRFVNQVSMQAPTSVSRRFTLNSIDEQHSGIRERVFQLQGKSGNLKSQLIQFYLMRNFIEKYLRLKRDNENAFFLEKHYKLVINFLWEGERFVGTITDFQYSRNISQNTHSYDWSVVIKTHGVTGDRYGNSESVITDYSNGQGDRSDYRRFAAEEVTKFEQENEQESGHLKGEDGVKLRKNESESELSKQLAGQPTLEGAAVTSRTKGNGQLVLRTAMDAAESKGPDFLAAAASTVLAAEEAWSTFWSDWVSQPLNDASVYRGQLAQYVSAFRRTAHVFRTAAGRYHYSIPEWRAAVSWYAEDVKRSISLFETGLSELGAMFTEKYWTDIFGGERRSTRLIATTTTNVSTPVVATPIPSGARSAFDVASQILGSRARWSEIVEANNMQGPYTLANGIPLEAGDILLIPAPAGTGAAVLAESFGSDLKVVDGDLALSGDDDLAVVRGEQNIVQSMRNRMKTLRGTNKAFPRFGLQKAINERSTSTIAGLVWSDIRSQVTSDIRVRSINKLTMEEAMGGVYQVNVEYSLVGYSRNNIAFQYNVPL